MKKSNLILLTVFIILFASFNYSFSQVWSKVEGTNPFINHIYFPSHNTDMIVIASDELPTDLQRDDIFFPPTGNGFMISTDRGQSFSDPLISDQNVYEIIQSNDDSQIWYAAVRKNSRGAIAYTENGGTDWETRCESSVQILDIEKGEESGEFYCAAVNTAQGLISTKDNFETCEPNEDFSIDSRSISISALNPKLMFMAAGGNQGGVYRTTNGGSSWIDTEGGLKRLRVLTVYASKYNEAVVFCGADSLDITGTKSVGKGIYQSLDTGKTWQLIGAKGYRVYDIEEHPSSGQYLAAACDSAGVIISGSWGYDWESYITGLPENASVREIAIPDWEINDDGFIVFAGVFGEGLWKSNRIKTNIDYEEETNDFRILDTRLQNDLLRIVIFSEQSSVCDLGIYSIEGLKVYSEHNVQLHRGENELNKNLYGISSGVYILALSLNGKHITEKFAIIR